MFFNRIITVVISRIDKNMEILKARAFLKYLKNKLIGSRVVLKIRIENRKALSKSNYNKFGKVIMYQNI